MKKLLVYLLVVQFVFGPLATADQNNASSLTSPLDQVTHQKGGDAEYQGLIEDPFIQKVRTANFPMKLGLTSEDASLDEDPFFLNDKHQEWSGEVKGPRDPDRGLPFVTDENSVTFFLSHASWKLNVPLKPILQTNDYLLLVAKKNFIGFENESQGLEDTAEGIFIVSLSELLSSSSGGLHVPVHFFPMPGHGWIDNVEAVDFPGLDVVGLTTSDGDSVPLDRSDIDTVLKLEKMNLLWAVTTTIEHNPTAYKDLDDLRKVIPDPKTTAGFGMLYTGVNYRDPQNSKFALEKTIPQKAYALLKLLNPIQQSKADKIDDVIARYVTDPKLAPRIRRLGTVMVISLITSMVVKYMIKRNYLKNLHAKNPDPKVGDVFAHTLTTLNKFAQIWSANTIEFLGDRYFPTLASGENSLTRKFMKNTVYFTRDTNDRLPVSGKTWLFGGPILGGIDTTFVYFQLYDVVPFLGHAISAHTPTLFGIDLKSRADSAFDQNNPNISSINQNEVIRNGAAYATSGASSFSGDMQQQFLDTVRADVRRNMLSNGIDPSLPKNAALFKDLVEERLDEEMQKAGLPSKNKFLFDAATLYSGAAGLLGYSLPKEVLAAGLKTEKFAGLDRPGLVISSTKKAIQALKVSDTPFAAEAQTLLEQTKKDMSLMRSLMFAVASSETVPVEIPSGTFKEQTQSYFTKKAQTFKYLLLEYRRSRQAMMTLTYNGDVNDVIQFIPDSWKNARPEAIALAAATFQKSLSDYMSPKEAPRPYVPQPRGFVARWQEMKSYSKAADQFYALKGYSFNPVTASEDDKLQFKKLYNTVLANKVGLYPYYEKTPELYEKVLSEAEKGASVHLADPRVAEFMNGLNPEERFKYEANITASYYMSSYLEAIRIAEGLRRAALKKVKDATAEAIEEARKAYPNGSAEQREAIKKAKDMGVVALEVAENSNPINAISPAQPGRLQKFRQWDFVKNSQVLTRLARIYEGLLPADQYQTGFKALADRNVPTWYYIKQANIRYYRNAIINATAVYAFNFLLFGLNLSPAMWALQLVAGFTIGAPAQILNRIFANQGVRQYGNVLWLAAFAMIYTWATFWGELPVQIFANDFQHLFNFFWNDHFWATLGSIPAIVTAIVLYKKKVAEKLTQKVEKARDVIFEKITLCHDRMRAYFSQRSHSASP